MNEIKLFKSKQIRSQWNEEKEVWFFAIVDVVEVLTESSNPRRYWSDLKRKMAKEGVSEQLYENIVQLKMLSADGKRYKTDCADAKTLLRIIQSIPSPNAEPFKLWLAQVGYERIEEIENPELAAQRARALYKAKGYSDDWIEAWLQSIAVRQELTKEWYQRGVKQGKEYAILTAEISRATFGITPGAHKELKGLKSQELRDHMTNLELVFTMLGEASTSEIAREDNAQGFDENKKAARSGGKIAGDARQALEAKTGRPVVSPKNYLRHNQAADELPAGDEPAF